MNGLRLRTATLWGLLALSGRDDAARVSLRAGVPRTLDLTLSGSQP